MAKRTQLTDGSGSWFSESSATRWDEATNWDGYNRISVATGSQWNHQRLYRTAGGRWVMYSWSQWQGSVDSYCLVDESEALRWLAVNGHDVPDSMQSALDALEV